MRHDRSTITIPRRICRDRGRRPARGNRQRCAQSHRKAAFSALLALVEVGLLIGDTSTSSPARDGNSPAPAHVRTGLRHGLSLQGVAGSPRAGKTLPRPMPSALAISVVGRYLVLSSRALSDAGKR
jgi:hypothetical protein